MDAQLESKFNYKIVFLSVGEWTTALSRKEKKMRGKKDDRQDRNMDDWSDEPQAETSSVSPKPTDPVTEPTPEVGPGGDNTEGKKPLDQRSTRKDRKKKVLQWRIQDFP